MRNIATNSPFPTAASDGWQHSQIVPEGDSYSIAFLDHVAPPSSENAPHNLFPVGPIRSSSHTAAMCPEASPTIACSPSRAAFATSFTTSGFDHVSPPSVERHETRSPASEPIALTTIAFPLMATRGPRCRPSISFGRSATFAGAPNDRPLSVDRASQMLSPDPNTIATTPLPAASCGWRFGAVPTGPTDKANIIARVTIQAV